MATSQSLSTVRNLKDIPALRQLAVLGGIAIAVAIGLWGWTWSQRPAYVPVYANLSDRDSAELADALRTAMIPFELDEVSGAVRVPSDQVHQARLKLAGQGLPRGSGQGFEAISQEQSFGISQFVESARYQHALETELARTIGNLQPVRAARVHLAIPKPSAFTRNREAPSASVFVQLQSGRELEQNQVASIVHMVAASVPGLSPKDVTVVDQSGRLMSNQNDSALAQSSEQLGYQRRIESDYVRRIEQLLAPLVGAGRVSAQVAADIDFSITEEARETYTPDATKIRSEQTSEDVTRGSSTAAVGVPGATSNQPPADKPNPPLNSVVAGDPKADIQTESKQATRSYELDRTLSHTRQSTGKLQRLSVAVLVDHVPRPKSGGKPNEVALMPLSTEELAQVQALVKEAVGFSASRGDTVQIQNAAFLQNEIAAAEPLPIWQEPQLQGYARLGAGLLLLLILIFVVVRPALRSLLNAPVRAQPPAALAEFATEGGAGLQGLHEQAQVVSTQPQQLAYEQKLQAARQAVAQDPKRVAQVVKNWVGQEA